MATLVCTFRRFGERTVVTEGPREDLFDIWMTALLLTACHDGRLYGGGEIEKKESWLSMVKLSARGRDLAEFEILA